MTTAAPAATMRDMAHHHHEHHHHHHHGDGGRPLLVALGLNAAYTALQVTVGLLAGSVALLADAGHNLSDVLALAIALGAVWFARRPATPRRSFGYRRAEILAALTNALSIVAVAGIILYEAVRRLDDPPQVPGGLLMAVAAGGIAVNGVSAWIIHRANRAGGDLNLRASFVHLAGDALASMGVVVAGALVVLFDWRIADPLIAIAIAVLIAVSAWGVLRESVMVLLEAAPRGLDPEAVGTALASADGVVEVHDLHVWSVASDFPAISAHVVVAHDCDCHRVRRALEALLTERFGIAHSTLQMEHRQARLLTPGATADRTSACH